MTSPFASKALEEFDAVAEQSGRAPMFVYSGPCTTLTGEQILSTAALEGVSTTSMVVEPQGLALHEQVARLAGRIGSITGALHVVTSPYQMEEALALFEALATTNPPVLQCSSIIPVPDESGAFSNYGLARSAAIAEEASLENAELYREGMGAEARIVVAKYLGSLASGKHHKPFALPDLNFVHDDRFGQFATLATLASTHPDGDDQDLHVIEEQMNQVVADGALAEAAVSPTVGGRSSYGNRSISHSIHSPVGHRRLPVGSASTTPQQLCANLEGTNATLGTRGGGCYYFFPFFIIFTKWTCSNTYLDALLERVIEICSDICTFSR